MSEPMTETDRKEFIREDTTEIRPRWVAEIMWDASEAVAGAVPGPLSRVNV